MGCICVLANEGCQETLRASEAVTNAMGALILKERMPLLRSLTGRPIMESSKAADDAGDVAARILLTELA